MDTTVRIKVFKSGAKWSLKYWDVQTVAREGYDWEGWSPLVSGAPTIEESRSDIQHCFPRKLSVTWTSEREGFVTLPADWNS